MDLDSTLRIWISGDYLEPSGNNSANWCVNLEAQIRSHYSTVNDFLNDKERCIQIKRLVIEKCALDVMQKVNSESQTAAVNINYQQAFNSAGEVSENQLPPEIVNNFKWAFPLYRGYLCMLLNKENDVRAFCFLH